jgi:hypothetical protein
MRRIAALHAEIDEIVARHVDAVAKECGSIPEGAKAEVHPRSCHVAKVLCMDGARDARGV